jgi:hypothetical protein
MTQTITWKQWVRLVCSTAYITMGIIILNQTNNMRNECGALWPFSLIMVLWVFCSALNMMLSTETLDRLAVLCFFGQWFWGWVIVCFYLDRELNDGCVQSYEDAAPNLLLFFRITMLVPTVCFMIIQTVKLVKHICRRNPEHASQYQQLLPTTTLHEDATSETNIV